MKCHEVRKYLPAFHDNELDVRTNVDILEHVGMCDGCAAHLELQRDLKRAVASNIGAVRAPEELHARITSMISGEARRENTLMARWLRFSNRGGVRAVLAAASILLVFGLLYRLAQPSGFSGAAVNAHIAALRDQVPTIISTGDAERAERVAFIKMNCHPPVPLFNHEEFQLVGAGPAQIELQDVGQFVFRYKGETVSMFVFKDLPLDEIGGYERQASLGLVKVYSRRGVNLMAWDRGGFTYILVADLPVDELLSKLAPRPAGE